MRRVAALWMLMGCPEPEPEGPPPIDLVSPLAVDEARAGVITDSSALFGGVGAEGRPGDILLINDRARFVIQAVDRASGGLVALGGAVLDADVVRRDGTPDADMVVDWLPALDVGWLPEPTSIEIIDDGIDSGTAVVRVEAEDTGFTYLDGVFEDEGRTTPRGVRMVTTFTLPAGSPLMRVDTELTAQDDEIVLRPGDILQAFKGIASPWVPGVGRASSFGDAEDAVMVVHDEHGLTLGIFADDADLSSTPDGGLDLLSLLVSFTSLYEPDTTLVPGEPFTLSRFYGVGSSPASLTDAWLAALGESTTRVDATVTDGSAPVAGVRVTVSRDGMPWTMAFTDAEGRVGVDVPEGGEITLVADGAGSRIHRAVPEGAGDASPLAVATSRAAALASIRDGATPVPHARGFGRTEGVSGDTLVLTPPGRMVLRSDAVDRFEVRVRAVEEQVSDDAWTLEPPSGLGAVGWARDGVLEVPIEPGTWDLLVWAGTRFEVHRERVEVTSGSSVEVSLTGLTEAFSMPGWFLGDTHIHAVPSFDGLMSPSDRALNVAASGLDVWFASEHDVAVDHTDLVAALGLEDALHVVGSVEITPWVRGHVNVFPVLADPEARAGGAWPWWENLPADTTEQFTDLLSHHEGVLVQINHPFSPGLPSFAGWTPGSIARPDLWWNGFDALEVIVPGQDPKGQALYADLEARGILSAATGSSDSHGPIVNDPGMLATWFHVPDAEDPGELTDQAVVAAVEARATVATNGPAMRIEPVPGSVLAPGTTLTVTPLAPSWIPLDRVELLRDGTIVEEQDVVESGRPLTFDLDPDQDASYLVVLRGEEGMRAISGRPAWAVSSAIRVDVDGDGWTAPLPPLRHGE